MCQAWQLPRSVDKAGHWLPAFMKMSISMSPMVAMVDLVRAKMADGAGYTGSIGRWEVELIKGPSLSASDSSISESERDPQNLIRNAVLESADGYAIFTMGLDRTVTSWNVGGEALFGWTAAEIIGQKGDLLFTEEDRARAEPEKEISQVLSDGRLDNARWFVSKDGDRVWAGGFFMPLKDGSGYLRVLRDWSPFWRNHEMAREAEDRFLQLGNIGPASVWVTDAEGETIFLSRSWYELNGIPEGSGLGWTGWFQPIHPDDRAKAKKAFARAVAKRARLEVEYRVKRADGVYIWVLDTATPRIDSEGKFHGYVGVILNIDDRKKAEGHREILLAELQHRVRNTLAIIRLMVRHTAETSDTLDEYVDHLEGRIDAFSRVQGAVIRDPSMSIDLLEIISEEMFAYGVEIGNGGPVHASGPPVRLLPQSAEIIGMVIHELATNAVKNGPYRHRRAGSRLSGSGEKSRGNPGSILPGRRLAPRSIPSAQANSALEWNCCKRQFLGHLAEEPPWTSVQMVCGVVLRCHCGRHRRRRSRLFRFGSQIGQRPWSHENRSGWKAPQKVCVL